MNYFELLDNDCYPILSQVTMGFWQSVNLILEMSNELGAMICWFSVDVLTKQAVY